MGCRYVRDAQARQDNTQRLGKDSCFDTAYKQVAVSSAASGRRLLGNSSKRGVLLGASSRFRLSSFALHPAAKIHTLTCLCVLCKRKVNKRCRLIQVPGRTMYTDIRYARTRTL